MISVRQLADLTGFSRDAIATRVKRWDLGKEFDPKKVLALRPLSEEQSDKISLEQARTNLAIEDTELKRIQRHKLEGDLASVDELTEKLRELFDGMAGIIKTSSSPDTTKEDLMQKIKDFGRDWAK